MTQLPSSSSPWPTSSGAYGYAAPSGGSYDPQRRASLAGSAVGADLAATGGAPLPAASPATGHSGWAAQPAYAGQVGYAAGQAYAPYTPQQPPYQQPFSPQPPSAGVASPAVPSTPVYPTAPVYPTSSYSSHPHPGAAPQRSSTFPSSASSPSLAQHAFPSASASPSPAQAAFQAHHRSLVSYYWGYAQQGFSAPLTAESGSEEWTRQREARREAVEWARGHGIAVQEAADETEGRRERERANSRPLPTAPSVPSAPSAVPRERERTTSRPLPVAPSGSSAPPPVPPLPSLPRSSSPTKPHLPLGRSVSLANPALPSSPMAAGANVVRSVSEGIPRSASPAALPAGGAGKRPLPVPPLARAASPSPAQLAQQLASVSLSGSTVAPHPPPPHAASPAVPSIALPDDSSSPAPPPVPSFSFDDTSTSSSTPPIVPSFSFATADEDDEAVPSPSPAPAVYAPAAPPAQGQAKPRLHPRYDPSHPSHALYHPTSVTPSPSTTSVSVASSSSLASLALAGAEAGTVTCSACSAPIFGRVLQALDRAWHPACFVCAEPGCGARLEVMEFEGTPEDYVDQPFVAIDEAEEGESGSGSEGECEDGEGWDSSEDEEGWVKAPRIVIPGEEEGKKKRKKRREVRNGETLKGKAWCMVHYEERFALHCHHCHTPIASADYLPIHDPALPASSPSTPGTSTSTGGTRYYHPLHFFCAGCGDPFIDAVAYEKTLGVAASPSPASAAPAASELEVKPYYPHDGHAYCVECDTRIYRPKCPGCRKGVRVEDGCLEVPVGGGGGEEGGEGEQEKQMWHEGCFKCSRCSRPLPSLYLLRTEVALVPRTRKQGGGFDEVVEERPYCADCYDVRAAEEAREAVEGK